MNTTTRAIFGMAVLLLGGWFLLAIFAPRNEAAPAGVFNDSKGCADCHQNVYQEWSESQHANSWVDEFVRELSDDFANKDCIDCHAPRPIFETGVGERVLPRTANRVEGVSCLSCHQLPDGGGMAGTITNEQAACRPVQRVELQRPEFCAGCHDQHQTVQQWRESSWAAKNIDCLDCHMPYRNGDPSQGRDHRCHGGDLQSMLEEAVELRGARDGDGWTVEVENVGAGHAFPTDERSRAADVFWRPLVADGEEPGPWRHLYRFRSPYRFQTDLPDTLLQADSTWTGRIEGPDAAGAVEVVLYYKRSPYYQNEEQPEPETESDASLVYRIELAP